MGHSITLAVDAVVFTVKDGELHLLLIERGKPPFKDQYALPGGRVEQDESLEEAVARELSHETGVARAHLHQLGAYGAVRRDPRGRVVSVAYLALIAPTVALHAATDAADARWFAIDDLPPLAFDHERIVADALKQLRYEIQTTNIAFQILPKAFSLSQLQALYESVLGRALDKRNFRKRIKELDLVTETGETAMHGAHRPAMLYRFAQARYLPLKEKVHVLL